ncbi:glucosamine-6-phosphate deaminase [candidate division KSB1 bacterium]|nr:glucosamine-6-phosphate deaminase [candidate division KSB1 bacterium]RQW09624.1 MAG: glucosamine-6-phosphate deaminase [candidate division KSB1 bacterium]
MTVKVYKDKLELGRYAADFVTETLSAAITKNSAACAILATGASQFEFLAALRDADLDWSRMTIFHLDEYKGMTMEHPASFRKYLRERILDQVQPGHVHFLQGDAEDIDAEVRRYEKLLEQHEVDIACIGIGENGHLAFNDPPVADFNDPRLVKIVELDVACRMQQLGEGWFSTFADVPTHALSLTIPAIMRCKAISCVAPDARKARAVRDALHGPVATACPASILRTHRNAVLWLDEPSAAATKGAASNPQSKME